MNTANCSYRSARALVLLSFSGLLVACGGAAPASGPAPAANAGSGGATGGATTGASGSSGNAAGGASAGAAGAASGGMGAATAGSGGVPSDGGSGGSAQGGVGGADPSTGDQLPWRPINVTVPAGVYRHSFVPKDADPMCVQQNEMQASGLSTMRPVLVKKLLVDLGYNRGELLDFFVHGGFHVLALDFMGAEEVPDIVAAGTKDPNAYGDIRLEALEGKDHTPLIDINYHDSLEGHLTEGLKFLQEKYPAEDWGYYLNQDGSVRYSDVIITGLSHGATSAARFGMVRRFSRVVSTSGPRDNTCGTDPACANGVVATWFKEVPKTPIDRFYAIIGTMDEQFPEDLYTMDKLGYLGKPTDVMQTAAPYGDSHRLTAVAGHARFCNDAQYAAACNYMFGVPAQNQ